MSKLIENLISCLFHAYNKKTNNSSTRALSTCQLNYSSPKGIFSSRSDFFSFGQDAVGVLQLEINADGACSKSAENRELRMDERSEDRQNSFFYIG
jgi:hypothetical protein